ncbi:excinuclease ABC subunit B [Phenylobacterium hankyongense]|uniref:Excinuclease ABC subunit B n=1 Tax=Phenylobacterium hankyongense TaxID=1813876 RepID=A0A328AYU7_9CAUL|nr:UvrB/UvrC motif-containing protein [Phenylobacterium hankyongense]RAK59361.1 excinuclease ABC subunit B [Phenylobacterium hankyongense]
MDPIETLKARLAKAVAEEDYETAAALRDAIGRLERGESNLREQVPGRMGLGSSQEDYVRDPARPLPKKPDPMTKGHKPGGRRSR